MANWNRWAVAAGLGGALAVFGPALAQTPQTPNNMGTSQQGTTDSATGKENGTRSGWSGSSATEPGERNGASEATQGSQGSSTGSTSDTTSAGDTGSSSGASASSGKVDKKLQDDLQKLHADNQAEVQMGQMGEQQASSPDVKEFAQKLQQDHQKLDDKVTQTAQSAGISLEGKAAQSAQKDADKEMQKLHGKTGPSFDKAFLSQMVKDHEKDIKAMQKAAKQARKDKQTELASLFEQAATGMKSHLQEAKQLEKTAGKKSARSSTSGSTGSGSTGGASATPGSSEPSSGSSGSSTSNPSSPSKSDTGSTGNPGGTSGSGQ